MNLIKKIFGLSSGNPQTPEYWVEKWWGKGNRTSPIITADTALTISAVYSAVAQISSSVAVLPLNVVGADRGIVKGTGISRLLERPNKYMDWVTFCELMLKNAILRGNFYAQIRRDNNDNPIELIPIDTSLVSIKFDDFEFSGRTVKYLNYYVERGKDQKPIRVLYDDMLHIMGMSDNGYVGLSVVSVCAKDNLGLYKIQDKNALEFFANSSVPSGILKTDSPMTRESVEGAKDAWRRTNNENGDIAVIHSGFSYQPIAIPAKDAQLLENRKFSVSDVARWFCIPVEMLQDGTITEQSSITFVRYTLNRWLTKIEQEFKYKLLPSNTDLTLDFDTSYLLKADAEKRSKMYQIALGSNNGAGWVSVNEVRRMEGMVALDDPSADRIFIPSFLTASDGTQNNITSLVKCNVAKVLNKFYKSANKDKSKANTTNNLSKTVDFCDTVFADLSQLYNLDTGIIKDVVIAESKAIQDTYTDDYISIKVEEVTNDIIKGLK